MKIAYLYYDLLNLYGEIGNIKIIENVLKQNHIEYEILYLSLEDYFDFESYDLVYISSGTENNMKIALDHLLPYKEKIKKYIEDNKYLLVTGNALEMFGKRIISNDITEGLGIFDFEIVEDKRIMKEVYIDSPFGKIIGFMNHNGIISDIEYPLFDREGVHYYHFFGTTVLGPVLVRNPEFLQYFLNSLTCQKLKYDLQLEKKAYEHFIEEFEEVVK